MLKNNARSKHFENSGFVFYEDANGFKFKSYEGLFCKKDNHLENQTQTTLSK